MTPPELLCPAGSNASLNAAVRGGADAVYLGLKSFNARRNADNFNYESLKDACEYAHLRGSRIYIALNTVILPEETSDVLHCAMRAYEAGADAFIIQDFGLAKQVSSLLPSCSVHLSTQCNIHDLWGIEAAALAGASRVTLARELSVEEIAHLSRYAQSIGIEIETFVHGALCVCYSGQCLMSSMIGSRSANRGLCAQACRLPYKLVCNGRGIEDAEGDFLLSPKDLCALEVLDQLIDAGVASFKIEGRMKSPEYVFNTSRVYRRAIDRICSGIDDPKQYDDEAVLESVFTRGFTTAYLEGNRTNDMMGYKRPNNRGAFAGRVSEIANDRVYIKGELKIVPGDIIEFWTGKGRSTLTVTSAEKNARGQIEIPIDGSRPSVHVGDRVFRVRSAEAAFAVDIHEPRVPVNCLVRLKEGLPLDVSFNVCSRIPVESDGVQSTIITRLNRLHDPGDLRSEAAGEIVEKARSKAITPEDVREHIGRMGDTPYSLVSIESDIGKDVGIGFSRLHNIRKEALSALTKKILAPYYARPIIAEHLDTPSVTKAPFSTPFISAIATNPACARAAKRAGAKWVYVPANNYRRGQAVLAGAVLDAVDQASYPKDVIIQAPQICHDAVGLSRENLLGIDPWEYVKPENAVLVESMGAFIHALEIGALPQAGSSMAITNDMSLHLLSGMGCSFAWLSNELNIEQIAEIAKNSPMPLGVQVSGALQLMVTEHCPLMSHGKCNQDCVNCNRRKKSYRLHDRKDYEFPVVSDALGRGHIYNSVPLDATPAIPKLISSGISGFLVDTTLMDAEAAAQAVGHAVHALKCAQEGKEPDKKIAGATSGHIYRGVV